jgi:YYY domain-containing protein
MIFDLLLVAVLLLGLYFRMVGIDWGEYQHLHPDERFLIWVGTDIQPVDTWSEYFDTPNSILNPHNVGHGFYVYGTLPMFVTRYVVEWIYGHSGFNEMVNVGRPLSAMMDLLTVFLVYLIAARIYDRRVGIIAALFSAAAVLQIQQSHFFTMDTFANFFTYLAIYFAIRVGMSQWRVRPSPEQSTGEVPGLPTQNRGRLSKIWFLEFIKQPVLIYSIGFGIAFGMAMASKISSFPVAVMLPAAFAIQMYKLPASDRLPKLPDVLSYLFIAGVISFVIFRLFQPYAFSGPGLLGITPNPLWRANILEQRNQAAGDVDFPPALQWARRPVWFSLQNLVIWGLGIPLAITAWIGFFWIAWRMLTQKNAWQRHILLWGWTAFYFTWQSLQFNPTMRYQLPIYPALAIFAAWAIVAVYDRWRLGFRSYQSPTQTSKTRLQKTAVGLLILFLSVGVVVSTVAWAYGFSQIYSRPITRVAASRWIYQNIPGPINLQISTLNGGEFNQPLAFPYNFTVLPNSPYFTSFAPKVSGEIIEIVFPHIVDIDENPSPKQLIVEISSPDGPVLASKSLISNFNQRDDHRGEAYAVRFDQPVPVVADQPHQLTLILSGDSGALALSGAAVANEGDWDDGLPLRVDGYDAFGGMFQPGLNFNMYTDDNPEKRARFISILDEADYLFISSSRQWGSLPRLPERFPLTSVYYRELLGCPAEVDLEHCYNVARPGTYQGSLGFELVQVFQSDPTVGTLTVNDQPSEEAFTVYDHPKVFIFQKSEDYDIDQVIRVFSPINFEEVVRITPKRAESYPANLMLPVDRLAEQRAGGTWSQLFDTSDWMNRSPVLTIVIWYLALLLIGLVGYPVIRLAFPGLADHGYPLARLVGLLLLAYFSWLAGSFRIPFSSMTISIVFTLLFLVSAAIVFAQRKSIWQEIRSRSKYFLLIEALFLLFFILDLLIRYGNPDLWHPWKGGEKPMDFAYLNAVLKSTTFPPYDPWYAGGYLNYYYYGFVIIAVLIKWLGVVPSVAYNLVIPTIFSMIALGAFSVSWNIYSFRKPSEDRRDLPSQSLPVNGAPIHPKDSRTHRDLRKDSIGTIRLAVGLAGALGMAVLGNLGTVRMIWKGYQMLAAPGGVIEGAGTIQQLIWSVQGFFLTMTGSSLPYAIGDWYWLPSRAIPALNDVEPITEFPFFTVLYGDPHAHLFALPITLLALSFVISIMFSRAKWAHAIGTLAGFFLGGLAIGALKPTNTWDFYPYLILACVAVIYAQWKYFDPLVPKESGSSGSLRCLISNTPPWFQRLLATAGSVLLLIIFSVLLYQPFSSWYALGYTKIDFWRGTHTPLSSYLVHWGLFLFIIISWMYWETIDWMANTPLIALRKLEPYKLWIQAFVVTLLLGVGAFIYLKIGIAWFVFSLAAWAGVLILRPALRDSKRFVLFIVGTGLILTLMVESIVLRGDIGRMNTVFKFYLQVWTLFAISAAPALGWLWKRMPRWSPNARTLWQVALIALVAGTAMYPLLASMAKVKDRMAPDAPMSLDGMDFMRYAEYADTWGVMDLAEDYRAIHWMQGNISGSPVIVEANLRDLYRWGSRMTNYTGFPGVVGWEWHQQQQRAILPGNSVSMRIDEIDNFYLTTDLNQAREFLRKYDVNYIILGQQERGRYPGEGLEKFPVGESVFWRRVYEDGNTIIYEVL